MCLHILGVLPLDIASLLLGSVECFTDVFSRIQRMGKKKSGSSGDLERKSIEVTINLARRLAKV